MNKKTFKPTASNIAFAHNAISALEVIATKRQSWELTSFKKANDALNALLAETLTIYNERFVKADKADMRELRIELTKKLKDANVRVVKTTTTLAMLVRFVFMSDRKRALRYAYVLQAAVIDGIAASALPAYIADAGGIEEIVRRVQLKAETAAKRDALDNAKAEVEQIVEQNELNPLGRMKMQAEGKYAVLLVKPHPTDGTVAVVGAVNNADSSLLANVKLAMAKAQVINNEADAANLREIDANNAVRAKAAA